MPRVYPYSKIFEFPALVLLHVSQLSRFALEYGD